MYIMTKIEDVIREMMKDPNVNLESLGQDIARALNTIQEEERKKKEEQEKKKVEKKKRLDDLLVQRSKYTTDLNRKYGMRDYVNITLEDAANIAAVALDNTVALSQNPQWNATKMIAAKSLILEILKYITEHPSFAMLGSNKVEDWNEVIEVLPGVKLNYSFTSKEWDKLMEEWRKLIR